MDVDSRELVEIGYAYLIKACNLRALPPYRATYITSSGNGSRRITKQQEIVILPKRYALQRPQSLLEQLEFALKHEGVNLEVIRALISKLEAKKIQEFIQEKPTGKYRRALWFLYEFLTNETLALPDIKNTPYVDLLDPKKYYTLASKKSKRHAINNNLLGTREFCPSVRKTKLLSSYEQESLSGEAKKLISSVEPGILARATNFLYAKETKSSFVIEKIKPDMIRTERFVTLLEEAKNIPHLDKNILIKLQSAIVDKPYQDSDYREAQNYVGELSSFYTQKIHYISPKPEDIHQLMSGFLSCELALLSSQVHPVVVAAILAFSFVFLRPFEDGNGRIHRFIMHYVLSRSQFTPDNIIFPISSVILKNIRKYDEILETFSKPLMNAIGDYVLDDEGILKVSNDTADHYRYIDYTQFAEYLFSCIKQTLQEDFPEEINFLIKYDQTKSAIQKVVDMPDNKIDRIIKCIAQNNGELGKKMRRSVFSELPEKSIAAIEEIVRENMLSKND